MYLLLFQNFAYNTTDKKIQFNQALFVNYVTFGLYLYYLF